MMVCTRAMFLRTSRIFETFALADEFTCNAEIGNQVEKTFSKCLVQLHWTDRNNISVVALNNKKCDCIFYLEQANVAEFPFEFFELFVQLFLFHPPKLGRAQLLQNENQFKIITTKLIYFHLNSSCLRRGIIWISELLFKLECQQCISLK